MVNALSKVRAETSHQDEQLGTSAVKDDREKAEPVEE